MDEQRKKRLIAKYSKSSAKRPEGSGGITSAAMDGVRVAEAIASCYAPFSETGK